MYPVAKCEEDLSAELSSPEAFGRFMTRNRMDPGHKCFSCPASSHKQLSFLLVNSSTPMTVYLSALLRHMLDVKSFVVKQPKWLKNYYFVLFPFSKRC